MNQRATDSVLSLADLYALPDDAMRHELMNGLLVSEPPPGARHGRVAARIVALLDAHVRKHGVGVVITCDTGFVLHESPATVRAPDIAFITLDRYRALADERNAIPGAPDLAVEVLSPGNRPSEIHAKVADYLTAGTPLVWVVDPEHEQVSIYRDLFAPRRLAGADALTADGVLPGFCVAVSELFTL